MPARELGYSFFDLTSKNSPVLAALCLGFDDNYAIRHFPANGHDPLTGISPGTQLSINAHYILSARPLQSLLNKLLLRPSDVEFLPCLGREATITPTEPISMTWRHRIHKALSLPLSILETTMNVFFFPKDAFSRVQMMRDWEYYVSLRMEKTLALHRDATQDQLAPLLSRVTYHTIERWINHDDPDFNLVSLNLKAKNLALAPAERAKASDYIRSLTKGLRSDQCLALIQQHSIDNAWVWDNMNTADRNLLLALVSLSIALQITEQEQQQEDAFIQEAIEMLQNQHNIVQQIAVIEWPQAPATHQNPGPERINTPKRKPRML